MYSGAMWDSSREAFLGMRARVVLPTRKGPSITMKRGSCGLRCGTRARLAAEESLPGIVSFDRARLGRGQQVDYSRVAARVSACLTARRRWESGTARPKM